MFTFLIVLFKNATQKETSDGLINGGISCDFVTYIILLKKIWGVASIYFLHYVGVFVLV